MKTCETGYPKWLVLLFAFGVASVFSGFLGMVVAALSSDWREAAILALVFWGGMACVVISLHLAERICRRT